MKKIGAIITGCYLFMVALSVLWIVYLIKADPSNSEFSGLPLLLLTLPWSMIAGVIIDQINPYLFDKSPFIGIGVDVVGALINSLILYLAFYFVENERTESETKV